MSRWTSTPAVESFGGRWSLVRLTPRMSPRCSRTVLWLSAVETVTVWPPESTLTCTVHNSIGTAHGGEECRQALSEWVVTSTDPGAAARYSAVSGCPVG